MKRFACGDLVPGCQASWVCSTEDEILALVATHASLAHGIATVSDELADAVRAAVVTVD